MEHAPLRPVPSRPEGPVDRDAARRHVAGTLPQLDAEAAAALALVALAGSTRPAVAVETGLSHEELAEALARARKALRRTAFPLPGSGWCERAERLISDRLDGALEPPGPRLLDAHLRNCGRCVEHERRLVQATDGLVADFAEAHPRPPRSLEPRPAGAEDVPAPERPEREDAGPEDIPLLTIVEPLLEEGEQRPVAEPAAPSAEPAARAQPPASAPEAAAHLPRPTLAGALAALGWHLLFALAVALAVATVVITALGVSGAEL